MALIDIRIDNHHLDVEAWPLVSIHADLTRAARVMAPAAAVPRRALAGLVDDAVGAVSRTWCDHMLRRRRTPRAAIRVVPSV
ncbi:hypothetical protein KIH27_18580 [Mycobacterium sp. M1]|uniref:Uncharacterized protein n=1 Tax=Mycolicibacter acidiphilus TaxID=2835306 RepID=A0ABS5RQ00_9MYCO|nr:hypothetical protein [Mycolicibacter acidiphilus]MBS9535596.1 hypothetical protein [Mycolicibacter acidiphilus]